MLDSIEHLDIYKIIFWQASSQELLQGDKLWLYLLATRDDVLGSLEPGLLLLFFEPIPNMLHLNFSLLST